MPAKKQTKKSSVNQSAAKPAKPRPPASQKCLIKGCKRFRSARGLCGSCRTLARLAIRRKQITEAELIDMGLLLPAISQREGSFNFALKLAMAARGEKGKAKR